MAVPTLILLSGPPRWYQTDVDTADGYAPGVEEIVAFVNRA